MKYLAFLAMNLLFVQCDYAQSLPVVQANSKNVSVRDGQVFQKGVWNLSPEVKPDVYQALEPMVEKRITFYTDIDSVSFDVTPGKTYDFLIVLNKKDTCYTRISTIRTASQTALDSKADKLMEPTLLQQDFKVFRESLEKHHAGIYTYRSKQVLDRFMDSCYLALNRPMTTLEFGKPILQVISALQDGHTRSNLPALLMKHYTDNEKVFPIHPYFMKNKAYVLCGEGLPAGTEIIQIDGRTIPEIRDKIYTYLPSDGSITANKRQRLNDGAFPIFYHWVYGNQERFEVQYKGQNGTIETIKIGAVGTKNIVCAYEKQRNNTKALQLIWLNASTALLQVRTFDESRIEREKIDFGGFLDSAFTAINKRKIKNLIIDVRDNGGGADDYGALLYSYLSQKPFRYFLSKASNTHTVKLDENPLLGPQKPQPNSFKGQVSILTNGYSFSTTADFCATARHNKRATFIGEETGGGYYGNTSGGRTEVVLPNSQIVVQIPLYKYLNAVRKAEHSDRGIIPDYEVFASIEDILQQKDVELALALGLMR
ncbi:S41 family peptidase [Emticicia agri]|nr:S41 family peptidase [Emticicia agri]